LVKSSLQVAVHARIDFCLYAARSIITVPSRVFSAVTGVRTGYSRKAATPAFFARTGDKRCYVAGLAKRIAVSVFEAAQDQPGVF
jgi:hypothetical protein